MQNPLIGKYVICRATQAGVHCGILESAEGSQCVLKNSRRLWYWKVLNGKSFLSGLAVEGPHSESKIGAKVETLVLTEVCEYIEVSEKAQPIFDHFQAH